MITTVLLGESLTGCGLLQEADVTLSRVHAVAVRAHGKEHDTTQSSKMALARLLGTMRRFNEAIKLFREHLTYSKAKYGATHPLTMITQSNLASALSNDKQYASAEPLLREMLVHQRRVAGKDDINTLLTVRPCGQHMRKAWY